MKKFEIKKQRDGQRAQSTGYIFDTKQEAVNQLHEIGYKEADSRDAIYTYSDDESIRLTAGDRINYSDILANPTESDDTIRIDVYTWGVEEVEINEEEESDEN